MSRLLAALAQHARTQSQASALVGEQTTLDYATVAVEVARTADRLSAARVRVLGLLLDNGPAWALLDLAAVQAGAVCVPLPGFFSAAQLAHTLRDAGVDTVVTDQPERLTGLVPTPSATRTLMLAGTALSWWTFAAPVVAMPAGTAKITYTSGTTGTPKGVCLSQSQLEQVVESLHALLGAPTVARHLCALPLATLLENVAGLYLAMLAGTTAIVPGLTSVGLSGSSQLQGARLGAALAGHRVTSAILVPQMLKALVREAQAGARWPALQFLAVGGAPVSPTLTTQARALGLPVYEGYGLSECASVVALNVPGADRPGSVGKPLPHVALRCDPDGESAIAPSVARGPRLGPIGEIVVRGAPFLGYFGAPVPARSEWATGDLGELDADGFLHLRGRKKNMFITAFGRNVAPEWVEAELTRDGAIAQAAVFGEGQAFNVAVLVAPPAVSDGALAAAVRTANAALPDYARVRAWLRAEQPFTLANGQFTGTGRPRRNEIFAAYRPRLEALYESHSLSQEMSA